MKTGLFFLTLVLFSVSMLYASNRSKVQVQKSGFKIELSFVLTHSDEKNSKFTLRKYSEVLEDNCTQPFLLPSKDILVAIPVNSRPAFRAESNSRMAFQDVVPTRNTKFLNVSQSYVLLKKQTPADDKFDGKSLFQIVGYTWVRDFYCAHIRVLPVSYDGQLVENYKITISVELPGHGQLRENSPIETKSPYDQSLSDIIYNSQIAEQFRNLHQKIFSDSTGTWINYNASYIKIPISNDGIYRITKSDLENAGVDVDAIDCTTFQLFESGKEIPLYIIGEPDGRLDSPDFIEFYATKNYSKKSYRDINANGEPYNSYMNMYTDTSFYFLTWGNKKGKRIPNSSTAYSAVSDTLTFHTATEHYEIDNGFGGLNVDLMKNQDPHWIETDLWYWGGISSGSEQRFNFNAVNLFPNKAAKFYLKVIGAASGAVTNAHALSLLLNSQVLDSKVISRNERLLLTCTISSNELKEGDNTLTLRNIENGNTPNSVVYDWFDVEYPQKLVANNNLLRINFLYDINPSMKVIKIENFTSPNVSVYKLEPYYKRIVNYSFQNGTLLFGDTVSVGDKYIVCSDNNVHALLLNKPTKFLNLRDSSNQYDEIIITNPVLRNSVAEYSQFINLNYSVRAKVFYTTDIFDEFGFGYPTAESIQEFLKIAYQDWRQPKPSYVLLVGTANYDYKNLYKKSKLNLVPSFGEPVSDAWYTIWEDTTAVQQMWIGRIPAATDDEVRFYLNKHREYLNQRYTLCNKSAIFFSGGDPNITGQIESLREVNDYINDNISGVAPYYVNGFHFYKTKNPRSDFGPYDTKFVQRTIRNGALFISYLGHSGTRVWDNSITQTSDLENDYNRYPLITDFGCSTAKFAEPDVDAFSNLFVLKSQAIAYIGNSSLGYTSTSLTAPKYFYESIFSDSIYNIAQAHNSAKQKIFDRLGSGGAYRIFVFTNTLIGDPIINLAVPTKPNFAISANDIEMLSQNPNDQMDSVRVALTIHNFGTQVLKPTKILIEDTYSGTVNYAATLQIPAFQNELIKEIFLPVLNKPGQHRLLVKLDATNDVDEIYEDDNSAAFAFNVVSTKIRPLIYSSTATSLSEMIFLNPQKNNDFKAKIIAEVSESPTFSNPIKLLVPIDTFYTRLILTQLINEKRYWMRAKLGENNPDWEQYLSFHKSDKPRKLVYDDSLSENLLQLENLTINGSMIFISSDTSLISVESAGGNFMKYGSIKLNGANVLPNTFNWGMGIAVFDSVQMKIDTTDTFWYGDNPKRSHDLATLINSIPNGKIVAMCAIDDASSNLTLELRNAIKTLGSVLVDNIGFRNPWLLIGKKGAKPGNVIEQLETASYQNILTDEKSFMWKNKNGKVTTDVIGPAAQWKDAEINSLLPGGSKIDLSALGYKQYGGIDTLSLNANNGIIPLSRISSRKYPKLKVVGNLHLSKDGQTPTISNFSVDFQNVPELGTNYQVVSLSSDTLIQGEIENLSFYVYNIGESRADSFKVRVEVVKPDNSREQIFEQIVDSLGSEKRKLFDVSYNTAFTADSRSFLITIDPDNRITELYKDNNLYSVPFYVKANTAPAAVKLTFDENDIINGDYVSSNPDIKVELNDLSSIPISDTSHVQLFLNNKRISLSNKEISYSYSSTNPKFALDYKPTLVDGNYTLKVVGTNATGQVIDSAGVVRRFTVSNQLKLLYVYNYPNPFSNETFFTFKLTQIPDELKIKIYTIAGRMIRELNVPITNLYYDFNKIEWDGRDQDGDLVANGVYIYNVIMKKGSEVVQAAQKLAVVR